VKPIAKTDLCEVTHTGYLLSGRLHTEMADGTGFDAHPGDLVFIPAGHDGWVVGDEPAVLLDLAGAEHYASHD
jgi:quercetin dioxygenase-like cupin family protein